MLKRNKLSIFLLAIVLMLTIYYVRSPKEKDNKVSLEPTTRYAEFISNRETLAANRSIELEKLASNISTNEDADETITHYNDLNSLTGREVALEEVLRNVGFVDVFVCVNLYDSIDVSVYDEDFSKSQYVMVRAIVNEEFGEYPVSIYHIAKEVD